MSFRKLIFALCALAFVSPAAAQVSKGTINTEINNSSAAGQPGGVILDNIVASYVDWLTCTGTGGLVYWSSGTPTCLGIGTTGQVLTVSGGAPLWATPSGGSGSPGGSNTQIQYNNLNSFGGVSGATTNGTTLTLASPIIDTAVTWLFSGANAGSQTIANPSGTTPAGSFVTTWQGGTVGGTTAIHLIPASGPLAGTVTTSEYVAGVTLSQAFGGNYGRWSYSNFASNLSGIVGEYGGTITPALFNVQIGVENPPSTFTSYEFWRAQTVAGVSEDNQVGATLFGAIQPNPATQQNRIVLIKSSIGSAGTRNSDAVLWEGKANNGSDLATWWRQYVNVLTNAGASCLNFDNNLNGNGGAYVNNGSLCDTGVFNARTGLSIAGTPISASSLSNGVTGSGAVVLASGSAINPTSIGAVTPGSVAATTLSASSTVSGAGFSIYLASPPAIGGTAPSTVNATTLSATLGLAGVTTNSNAPAGDVGELQSSGLATATPGTATVTITIAAPGVVTWTGHGLTGICPVVFTTTGALPTGITSGTVYWTDPASITTNTFKIATSIANAIAGTDITTTGTQSGTQTGSNLISTTNNAPLNIAALSLTAGDWDVAGAINIDGATSTTVSYFTGSAGQTSATLNQAPGASFAQTYGGGTPFVTLGWVTNVLPVQRISLSGTTTIYLVNQAGFAVSTLGSNGFIRARRVR